VGVNRGGGLRVAVNASGFFGNTAAPGSSSTALAESNWCSICWSQVFTQDTDWLASLVS